MIERPFWAAWIEASWRKAPIVWLSGVRRVGKTTLARQFQGAEHLNCDLPSVQRRVEDPESFFRSLGEGTLVLDEVHQLPDPSRLLKIGADAFPGIRILATGSSTLAATEKFRDSLTGRKRAIHLTPVRVDELAAFGVRDLRVRLHRGGLPPALMATEPDPGFYSEWLDSYYARDVQELFRVEKRSGFLRLVEAVLRLSGGQLEVSTLSNLCGLSRPTIQNYLNVLELTHVATLVRPYCGGGTRELVRQPKVYGFDTGFVAHARGWTDLRPADCGILWEHVVHERLASDPAGHKVNYWRDKDRHEVDFVVPRGRDAVDAIECKWNADAWDPGHLRVFRALHPQGRNWVVSPNVTAPLDRDVGGLNVTFSGLEGWQPAQDLG
ncbi:MAG: ATP-binding protein [Verrucomicrobiota bacterium]